MMQPTQPIAPTEVNPHLLIPVDSLRPRPRMDSWDWICEKGRTPDGSAFDWEMVPWTRGVVAAWDDPRVRMIALKWGTRLAKTLICLLCCASSMDIDPRPGIFASSVEKLAIRSVKRKWYPMLEAIGPLADKLPPRRRRGAYSIDMDECQWAIGWAGSATMLADFSAQILYANEVSKWLQQGDDGDPFNQALERVKEYPDHKALVEGTPAVANKCRIEAEVKAGSDCRYHVHCPKCRHPQVLTMGTRQDDGTLIEGGILWDRPRSGESDPELARTTARYQCGKCRAEWGDDVRPALMRGGSWVSSTQWIDRAGRIHGEPKSVTRWSSHLSSLYSLQLRWGDVAEAFVRRCRRPSELRTFVNLWLGETFRVHSAKTEPEELAERLCVEGTKRGEIPAGYGWLVATVDVQDTYLVWQTWAYGEDQRGHLVDWGYVDTWAELYTRVIDHATPAVGPDGSGGPALKPALTLIDSSDGQKTHEVYRVCRQWSRSGRAVVPCKGAATNMGGEPYKRATVGDGTKKGKQRIRRQALRLRGVLLIHVNHFYWEPVVQQALDNLRPGEPESLSLPPEAAADTDLLEQLLNGVMSEEPSKRDPDQVLWVKRWDELPNDHRDCALYGRCAIELVFRGDWTRAAHRQPSAQEIDLASPPPRRSPAEKDAGRRRGRRERPRRRRSRD